MDETKLTADLPNLRMEVLHRRSDDGRGEQITIQLQAMPDFRSALPLLGSLMEPPALAADMTAPWNLWLQMTQAWMAPWAALAQANPMLAFANDHFLCKFKK